MTEKERLAIDNLIIDVYNCYDEIGLSHEGRIEAIAETIQKPIKAPEEHDSIYDQKEAKMEMEIIAAVRRIVGL